MATTLLERALADLVVALTDSPATTRIVRGERGSTLTRMVSRLLEDQTTLFPEAFPESGYKTSAVAATIGDLAKRAGKLVEQRDEVAHSTWYVFTAGGADAHAVRITRGKAEPGHRDWTLEELDALTQAILNLATDIENAIWNLQSELNDYRWGRGRPDRDADVDIPW